MNFGLTLIRFLAGIAALWGIAFAYQQVMSHAAGAAIAEATQPSSTLDFHPVNWSNCSVGVDLSDSAKPGSCPNGASHNDGVIPGQ